MTSLLDNRLNSQQDDPRKQRFRNRRSCLTQIGTIVSKPRRGRAVIAADGIANDRERAT